MNTFVIVFALALSAVSGSVLLGSAGTIATTRGLLPQAALIAPASGAVVSRSIPLSGGIIAAGVAPQLLPAAPLLAPSLASRTIIQGPSGLISSVDNGAGIVASNGLLAPGLPLGRSLLL